MRPDMAKVLVERERFGSRFTYRDKMNGRVKFSGDPDKDDPKFNKTKQSMKFSETWDLKKQLNENLSPLRRFLLSRCGRKWDDVYSEIRKNLGTNSAVDMHIMDHLWDFVVRDVVMIAGVPHRLGYSGYVVLEAAGFGRYYCFYIDEDGILQKVKTKPKKRYPMNGFLDIVPNQHNRTIKCDGKIYHFGIGIVVGCVYREDWIKGGDGNWSPVRNKAQVRKVDSLKVPKVIRNKAKSCFGQEYTYCKKIEETKSGI